MMPVVLWTDALVFLLLAVGGAAVWWVRRQPHLLLPWRRAARSATAMISLLVLSLFLVVGLLDSVHYRKALPEPSSGQIVYAPEVLSALDGLLSGLRERNEKTYSAPLAVHLYAKESIELPNGGSVRVFPRLVHGGAHLVDPTRDRIRDVWGRGLAGGVAGAVTAVVLYGLALLWLARRKRKTVRTWLNEQAGLPLRRVLAAVIVLGMLIGATVKLAAVYHVLGTDKVGQDVLYLSLKSIRTGLVIGTLTTLVMLPFALLLGVAAGYFRGWVDDVIQYVYTVLSSVPSVLLIAASVLMVQVYIEKHADWFATAAARADIRLLCLCLIMGITSWTGLCRLLRGEALKLRELEYIQAAQAFGVSSLNIMVRHLIPNVMHIVLISVVIDFSGLVLAEAVLSYIGVGVDPSTISFGTMINAARLELGREPVVWWSLASAFGFMLVLVLAANLFADALRDAFDPRLNRTEAK
jgi:peptide/nickel transport system permease protein